MLDQIAADAGDDRVAHADGLATVKEEVLAGDYDDADRSAILLFHALAEWGAKRNEKAYAAIAETMAFCARNRLTATFQLLREHASLDDLRIILTRHCPADASVDDTLAMLANLDAICE
jgi:hypothetical protein